MGVVKRAQIIKMKNAMAGDSAREKLCICDEADMRWRDYAICDKRSKGQRLVTCNKGGTELGGKGAKPYITL